MRTVVAGCGAALSVALLCTACVHDAPLHRFDNADEWAVHFEDPKRDEWQKPDEVLKALALPPDARVADIGAATGYFPVRIARAVPQGHVYGVDIESSMVTYLANRAKAENLTNLTAVLASADDAHLPEAVDLISVVNTYHHLENRPAYFARLARSLRPKGRLVIIDFTLASALGPPAHARIPPDVVTRELAEAGFVQLVAHSMLPEQYFLVFTRK